MTHVTVAVHVALTCRAFMFTDDTFDHRGRRYSYWHNKNWAETERAVEIPIGLAFLERGGSALEVGNVMRPHMRKLDHMVIDLMEQRPNWSNYANEDVLAWEPTETYDRVLSISTLEHTTQFMRGIERTLSWSPNVLITVPLGYKLFERSGRTAEDYLDEMHRLCDLSVLRREAGDPYRWYEADIGDCVRDREDNRYGTHPVGATAIAVLHKGAG